MVDGGQEKRLPFSSFVEGYCIIDALHNVKVWKGDEWVLFPSFRFAKALALRTARRRSRSFISTTIIITGEKKLA